MEKNIITGIKQIDEKSELKRGELVMLLGNKHSIASSGLALQMALNMTMFHDTYCSFASFKFTALDIYNWAVEIVSKVPFTSYGIEEDLHDDECQSMGAAMKIVYDIFYNEKNLDVADNVTGLGPDDIVDMTYQSEENIGKKQDIIFINSLNEMNVSENLIDTTKSEKHQRKQKEELILEGLKKFAEERNVCVVLLADLSILFLGKKLTKENLIECGQKNIFVACDKVLVLNEDYSKKPKDSEGKRIVEKTLTVFDKNGLVSQETYNYDKALCILDE